MGRRFEPCLLRKFIGGRMSEDAKYLIENKNFAKLMDSRKIYLDVHKVGSLTASYVIVDDPSLSYDQNLLNRYTIAVDILLT